MSAHVLMLSSSRVGNEDYLEHARPMILEHLSDIRDVLFVPYAGVTMSYDAYTDKVQAALPEFTVTGIHTYDHPEQAITDAQRDRVAILVGGGNTFNLLTCLYRNGLIEPIKAAISTSIPYIGWSAGSNICGATIRTTNDMPIIEPPSFDALALLPCQLNPHYSDYHPPGFNGETRDQRLAEFTTLNPDTPVLAIREGTALLLSGGKLMFRGVQGGFIFRDKDKTPIEDGDDLSQIMQQGK